MIVVTGSHQNYQNVVAGNQLTDVGSGGGGGGGWGECVRGDSE